MSDTIPQDIRGEALDLLRLIVPEIGDDGRAYIPADEIETIARALLAHERETIERCAKTAQKDDLSIMSMTREDALALRIAAEILETAR